MIGKNNRNINDGLEVSTLGGGCFWCLDAAFIELDGIMSVASGYSGGESSNPSYEEVCSGRTGHAEVIQVSFDPETIPYRDVLSLFFALHDPTTLNRQGADVGTQYRSVIFYHSDTQKSVAEELISELNSAGIWQNPIVTETVSFEAFFPAEDYHQGYYSRNDQQPYCRVVITPKLAKFRKKYATRLKQK
jgi:peptide-methionine (S)-S-oxide reductase